MVALKKTHTGHLSYRDAGVDIDAGDRFVKAIAPIANATARSAHPGTIGGIGAFGALFDIKQAGFTDPILVSSTDGVGTKLRIAIDTQKLDTIGIDLVAMCVNDILVHGAQPLFFLDYFACGKLTEELGEQVMKGIAEGCIIAGAALVGGETAEMPGFYAAGDFDLAGFAVGAVERGMELPKKHEIKEGDVLVGLASSGVHSNGYSMVRRLVDRSGLTWSDPAPFNPAKSLGEALLTPTKIYVKSIMRTLEKSSKIKALAHITGSGALRKLHRILPDPSPKKGAMVAHIRRDSWRVPAVFTWLRQVANWTSSEEDQRELLRIFNCGIGMVAIVEPSAVETVRALLKDAGEETFIIGEIENNPQIRAWDSPEDAVRLSGNLMFEDLPAL